MSVPYLKDYNNKKLLMVQEKPFIMLAGEVHNSNASSAEYMEEVWKQAEALGMNCLLIPISWEMIEPEEGKFDFSIVDGLISQAGKRNKKLGILWFGSWKNAECRYAPVWVKKDLERFPRAQIVKGENQTKLKFRDNRPYTTLSYLSKTTRDADARAFGALMAHIRDIDSKENIVVTVQVENETGILGTAREHSDEADALFESSVPEDFADYMKAHTESMTEDVRKEVEAGQTGRTWRERFGSTAEEIFSAYYIARFVETVAEAGKREYPLPMTVNCWLNKNGEEPGQYPSGGPVSRMHEVWDFCAPSIDMYCPDIYVPDFCGVCEEFTRRERPLYIPECATHSYAGPRQIYVIGHYHAIYYAPFGFEDMGKPFSAHQGYLFGMDVTDPALKVPQNVEEYAWYTRTLNEMIPLLADKYGTKELQAVCSEQDSSDMQFYPFGVRAVFEDPVLPRKDGVCLALKTGEDECYILANRCCLSFFSTDPDRPNTDILLMEEGRFEYGIWRSGRRLNGDEAVFMQYESPVLLRVQLFVYA
ncbi:MAG: DUF5597 domain-containing protein [Eubacteriales bacterium]|nr:DUF5597 domain-containing protein [Eubacteriales bacterium]